MNDRKFRDVESVFDQVKPALSLKPAKLKIDTSKAEVTITLIDQALAPPLPKKPLPPPCPGCGTYHGNYRR